MIGVRYHNGRSFNSATYHYRAVEVDVEQPNDDIPYKWVVQKVDFTAYEARE